jgi:hypothetical protein
MAGRLTRLYLAQLGMVLSAQRIFLTLLAAALAACVMAIPRAGLILALGLLTYSVSRYRSALGLSGSMGGPVNTPDSRYDWLSLTKYWAWNLVAGLILISPFLLRHGVMDSLGWLVPLRGWAVAIAAAISWLVFPLGMLATSARGPAGPVSAGRAIRALGWHPVAAVLALLVVPLGLVLIEALLWLITWQQAWVGVFVTDMFPTMDNDHFEIGGRMHLTLAPQIMPDWLSAEYYFHGFRHGYTLLGSIAASVFRGINTRFSPRRIPFHAYQYLSVRILFTTLILTGVVTLLHLQARWLGLLASVDSGPSSNVKTT